MIWGSNYNMLTTFLDYSGHPLDKLSKECKHKNSPFLVNFENRLEKFPIARKTL